MIASSPTTHRLWAKRLLIAGVVVVALSLSPLIPALLGLALNNDTLQTYHWLLLATLPVGLPLGGVALLGALVLWILAKVKEGKTP